MFYNGGTDVSKRRAITISELAEILDKNEKAVKNALSRITDKLEIGSELNCSRT
jgi:hypothetical protein